MPYQYKTTFFPLVYPEDAKPRKEEKGDPPYRYEVWPSPETPPELDQHLNQMGQEGWELVSVQPIHRNQHVNQVQYLSGLLSGNSLNTSYRFPLHLGYYFFWKREG